MQEKTLSAHLAEYAPNAGKNTDLLFGIGMMLDRRLTRKDLGGYDWRTLSPEAVAEKFKVWGLPEIYRHPVGLLIHILKQLECDTVKLEYADYRTFPRRQSVW